MAGGTSEDNPVGINVTAMVDIIFCLCLFFMCSMHFKQVEAKIETWLPKHGSGGSAVSNPVMEEIRVFMRWDDQQARTLRKVGNRIPATSDDELMQVIVSMAGDFKRAGKAEFPVVIDATAEVPWQDVIRVMDLCKRERMERIEFAEPMPQAASWKRKG